jgi:hypothetical protein
MRSVRSIVGLAVAVCAFGVIAAPALAKEPKFYGEFTASKFGQNLETEPALTKGHGEVEELRLGPYNMRCNHEFSTHGEVNFERSTTFSTELKLKGCEAEKKPSEFVTTWSKVKFSGPIDLTYSANGSAAIVVTITQPDAAVVKVGGESCVLTIPTQSLPLRAEKQPEPNEPYSFATYSTETTPSETNRQKEIYGPERDRLFIENNFKKIKSLMKPNEKCETSKTPETEYNEETGYLEFQNGIFVGGAEIETIKGNLGFSEEEL